MDYEHLEYHRQRARELVERAEQERLLRPQRSRRNPFRRRNVQKQD